MMTSEKEPIFYLFYFSFYSLNFISDFVISLSINYFTYWKIITQNKKKQKAAFN